MKSALTSIKDLLELDRTLDQPATLEAALKALQLYHTRYGSLSSNVDINTDGNADPAAQNLPVPISLEGIIPVGFPFDFDSPSFVTSVTDDHRDESTDYPPAFLGSTVTSQTFKDLSSQSPVTSTSLQAHSAKRPHEDLIADSFNFDTGSFDLAMHAIQHPSLQSSFIRCSIGLCVVDQNGGFLDCNQYMLNLLKAPDFLTLGLQQASLVVDGELMHTAITCVNRPESKTIRCLEMIQRLDGQRIWIRLVLTRMKEQHDVADPASRLSGFQHTYFAVAQEEPAPVDGRGRVWSDEHLLHMGLRQETES